MTILRRSPRFLIRRASARLYHATSPTAAKLTVGIRREDPLRIWERRCPLTPDAVNQLVKNDDVDVLVEDCDRRVWNSSEFVKAGAKVVPALSPAHIILGIKETPLHEVLNGPVPSPVDSGHPSHVPRTHFMFSHTIKGQHYNMELLSKFVSSSHVPGGTHAKEPALLPRLIDYEMLTGDDGKRTVGFGYFAGVAGALESMGALAHAHLELGVASPFLYTPRPHTHPTLASIRSLLKEEVGARIATEGTPKSLGPIVFGVTGTGKVAEGVLDILNDLPIVKVTAKDLPVLVSDPNTDLRKIYVVHALPSDYFVRRDGRPYDRSDYYANPQEYGSEFHTKIAPYLSLLLHGAGWSPSFPRLMTNEQLAVTLERAQQIGKGRFACVGDISCDIEGGLEFLPRHSTQSSPFFSTRPSTLPAHLPSLTMMAVDILPTSLPLEASQHFSRVLMPYLRTLIGEYRTTGQGAQHERIHDAAEKKRKGALRRATVAQQGKLTEEFRWLERPLGAWSTATRGGADNVSHVSAADWDVQPVGKHEGVAFKAKKKVLMLGSGMVAGPAIEELCKRTDVQLLVASNLLHEAERQTRLYPNATALFVDMNKAEDVGRLIAESDLVISLLPVPFHPSVAALCIQHRKHLVTASYILPNMRELHSEAVAADVLLLNEIGLDPGIDHCSTLSLLDSLREQGKQVVSYSSFCGGLPAPECADVPLGYKFSWNPRGVLTAALNDARFKVWNKIYSIDGDELLASHIPDVPISNVLRFEGLPNRNSLPYAKFYGLGPEHDLRTIFRGTLRYPGFSKLMDGFSKMGLLDSSAQIDLKDWTSLGRKALEERLGTLVMNDEASITSAIRDATESSDTNELVEALRWLSLMPPIVSESITEEAEASLAALPPVPQKLMAPVDFFAALLAHKLRYQPVERDLVVLHHEIVTRPAATVGPVLSAAPLEETYTSQLIAYGTPTASAMSRCVGLPVAFAALRVLDGEVHLRGVHGPTDKTIYKNVLARLTEVGLGMTETVKSGPGLVESTLRGARTHYRQRSAV